jgi:glycosyltransferase involved in cell wall biosynthesis
MITTTSLAPAAPATATLPAATAVATLPPSHRLSVVVPMYNEIENAAPLIDAVQAALASYPAPWELIVVDDGSRDGTGEALVRHGATVGPHIHVVRLARNFRQTAAMQAGIDAARGDVIVTMDGDLQNDPADIPKLVDKLVADQLDMVAGWREKRKDGWILRKVPSWLANRLITRITGLKFHDLGCSLKAFRASVLKQVRLYGEMHRFIPAWLATVTSPDRMGEVPVRHHARLRGTSKYGLSRTLRVVVDVLSIYFFLNFGSRPGHFFGVIGLAVTSIGTLMLGYLGVLKLMGESIGGRPLLLLGFFCVIGGLQFLMTGVLAELLVRVYFDGNHAKSYTALPAAESFGAEGGWSRP